MNRRTLLTSAALLATEAAGQSLKKERALIELRYYYLRTGLDNQQKRVTELLQEGFVPAAHRGGIKTIGVFAPVIAPRAPFLMVALSFESFTAMDKVSAAVDGDEAYHKAIEKFHGYPGASYVRMERQLLRCFPSMPEVEVPKPGASPRIFELRTYESNHRASLKKKIGMFDDGEIRIFRKNGLLPVFFGDTLFGVNLPNLTYMLAFDNLAAREKNWSAFGADPDWAKLRSTPGLGDADMVSNISNSILRPLSFSDIK